MNDYPWIKEAYDIKEVQGERYIRIAAMPEVLQYTIKKPDRTKIRCLRSCCYNYEEYMEENYFLSLYDN